MKEIVDTDIAKSYTGNQPMDEMTPHPLRTFLERSGLTQAQFAKKIGLKQPTLSDVIRGRHRFSAQVARKIQRVTKGRVTVNQLLFGKKPTKVDG